LLSKIPQSGKIYFVRDGQVASRETVLTQWKKAPFLRDQNQTARGWLIEVIGKSEFQIDDVYAFEKRLGHLYPGNKNVKPKIRQQLQFLRDRGYLEFVSRGYYRLRSKD